MNANKNSAQGAELEQIPPVEDRPPRRGALVRIRAWVGRRAGGCVTIGSIGHILPPGPSVFHRDLQDFAVNRGDRLGATSCSEVHSRERSCQV